MLHSARSLLVVWMALGALACTAKVDPLPRRADRGGGAGGSSASNGKGNDSGGSGGAPGLDFTVPDAAPAAAIDAPIANTTCAANSHAAAAIPVDIFFLVDISGSMTEAIGGQSKWQMERNALDAFVKDARSAGLGAGLQFFPLQRTCMTDADCRVGAQGRNLTCAEDKRCLGKGIDLADADECEDTDDCLEGTCLPIGACLMTGAECANIGQPCAGGVAGDTCTARPKLCQGSLFQTDPAICDSARYAVPAVSIANLPPNAMPLSTALQRAIPQGPTPMSDAVKGSLQHVREHVAAHPERKAVFVLVTDGLPSSCSFLDGAALTERMLADVGAAFMGTPSIPTYAMGVFGMDDDEGPELMGRIAVAGGTGEPLVVRFNADLTRAFQTALDAIRGATLPCSFAIPAAQGGAIDFGKVNFHVEGSQGSRDLLFVKGAGTCDATKGGWYYNVDPAAGTPPTQVVLCPASCMAVKADPSIKVELRFGCQTRIVE